MRNTVLSFITLIFFLISLCWSTAYGNVQDDGPGYLSEDVYTDAQIAQAMEIFAGMSPEEMEEAVKQLMLAAGDNPQVQAKFEKMLDMLKSAPKKQQEKSTPKKQQEKSTPKKQQKSRGGQQKKVKDDKVEAPTPYEVEAATQEALRLLGNPDWQSVWEKQDVILEAVITAGQLPPKDAASFRSDEFLWNKELRFIWGEMQKQARQEQEIWS